VTSQIHDYLDDKKTKHYDLVVFGVLAILFVEAEFLNHETFELLFNLGLQENSFCGVIQVNLACFLGKRSIVSP
jgi:hypothetical protein